MFVRIGKIKMTTYDTKKDMSLYCISFCDTIIGLVVDKTFRTTAEHENTLNTVIKALGFEDVVVYTNSYPGNISRKSITMNQLDEYWTNEKYSPKCVNVETVYSAVSLFIQDDDDALPEAGLLSCVIYPTVDEVSKTREYMKLGRNVYMLYISKDWSEKY